MKNKKLKKQLNKLLPDGVKVAAKPKLWVTSTTPTEARVSIYFNVEREPTKEQLLAKAKRDYFDGVVFESVMSGVHTSDGDDFHYNNGLDTISVKVNGRYRHVYRKCVWSKILKKPVIKVDNKWLYEGDKWFQVQKGINWCLKKFNVNAVEVTGIEENGMYKRFLTKQKALDFVMLEAKDRFEGAKRFNFIDDKEHYSRLKSPLYLTFMDPVQYIGYGLFTHGHLLWTERKGFIAEPIKETPLMLGECEVAIIKETVVNYENKPFNEREITYLKSNGVQVIKEDWLKWQAIFIPVVKAGGHVNLDLDKYETLNTVTRGIMICYIKNITIEQIEAITKALNKND